MSAYYDELFDERDPTRAAGWRHAIEQALRFEFALSRSGAWFQEGQAPPSLLDVGCGPGALRRYLRDTGRAARYVGIDRYAPSVALARRLDPSGDYVEADLLERASHPQQFDLVMAIGAIVDGQAYRSDRERQRRLLALTRALCGLCREHACLVVLRHEELVRHPSLSQEPALVGATRQELDALMRHLSVGRPMRWCVEDGPTTLDRGLFIWRQPDSPSSPSALEGASSDSSRQAPWSLHERVLAGPWGQGLEPWRAAWFWWISGRSELALALVGPVAIPGEPEPQRALRERLLLGL